MSTSTEEKAASDDELRTIYDNSDDSSGNLSSTDSEAELNSDEEVPVIHLHTINPERLLKIHDRWHAPYQNNDFIAPDFRIRDNFEVRRADSFELDYDAPYFKYEDEDLDTATVEYEIDHEDLLFICHINKIRTKSDIQPLTETKFEEVMDALEKACHFQCTDDSKQFDQSSACCICREGEADQQNQIIFCDMCNIAVHQDCYGVPYVPEGQWFCRRCQISPSVAVPCVACFQTTGALKRTTCGRWAHVVCTIWVSELHFGNTAFMEPIENVEIALKNRRTLRCIVCTKRGACLQCSKKQCSHAFHVTCAISAGFEMHVNESAEGVEADVYSHFIFCPFHSFCGSGHGHKKHKIREMVNIDHKVLKETAVTSIPVVTPQKIEQIARRLKMGQMDEIVTYWFQKRKAHGGIPLIRRLQVGMTGCRFEDANKNNERIRYLKEPSLEPEPQPGPSGLNVMSDSCYSAPPVLYPEGPTGSAPEDAEPVENLKEMLTMIVRREKLKRTRINLRREFFEKSLDFLHKAMLEVIDLLSEKDVNSVFALPVREEEVPGYHRIIKHPMDLSKMRKKVEDSVYHGLSDLRADFILMMDNCKAFNKENAFFLDYGSRFRSAGFKVIRQAEKRAEEHAKIVTEVLDSVKRVKVEKLNDEEEHEKPPEIPVDKKLSFSDMPFLRHSFGCTSFSKATEESDSDIDMPILEYAAPFRQRSGMASDYSTSGDEQRDDLQDPWNVRSSPELDESLYESEDQFFHDDIVWVDRFPAPGRVVDPRMKALISSDMSFTQIMQDKPKEAFSGEYALVFFFDKHNSWGWFPLSDIRHCDVTKEAENGRSDVAMLSARSYWENLNL